MSPEVGNKFFNEKEYIQKMYECFIVNFMKR